MNSEDLWERAKEEYDVAALTAGSVLGYGSEALLDITALDPSPAALVVGGAAFALRKFVVGFLTRRTKARADRDRGKLSIDKATKLLTNTDRLPEQSAVRLTTAVELYESDILSDGELELEVLKATEELLGAS